VYPRVAFHVGTSSRGAPTGSWTSWSRRIRGDLRPRTYRESVRVVTWRRFLVRAVHDERVNMVTPHLVARYPTPKRCGRRARRGGNHPSTGFYRPSEKRLLGNARALSSPTTGASAALDEAMVKLARRRAQGRRAWLRTVYASAGRIAVDTHVLRVGNRPRHRARRRPIEVRAPAHGHPSEGALDAHHRSVGFHGPQDLHCAAAALAASAGKSPCCRFGRRARPSRGDKPPRAKGAAARVSHVRRRRAPPRGHAMDNFFTPAAAASVDGRTRLS
jgi:endonuclease III